MIRGKGRGAAQILLLLNKLNGKRLDEIGSEYNLDWTVWSSPSSLSV